MKLRTGLIIALAGLSAAVSQPAEIFLLQRRDHSSQSTSLSLSRQLARLIFLQRLHPSSRAGSLKDLPESISEEDAISHLNEFGKAPHPLFAENTVEPLQLMIMLEGITFDNAKILRDTVVSWKPAFTVSDVPSSAANKAFVERELTAQDVSGLGCSVAAVLNPVDDCAKRNNRVARYDVQKNLQILEALRDSLPQLARYAELGEMETTLVLLPEHTRKSPVQSWSTKPLALHARQATEEVITEAQPADPLATSVPASKLPLSATANFASLPACYKTASSCMAETANCSGHGECENKYRSSDGTPSGDTPCFACMCKSTKRPSGTLDQWTGAACHKIDLSVPFWLFAGFTIVIIAALSFAIGMLFNVGEEKLPGVIGAGVSKPK